MYKVSQGSTLISWSYKLTWPSLSWSQDQSDTVLSSDGSLIYSFISYGDLVYVHFASLNSTNGNIVGQRYKSNQSIWQVNSVSLFSYYVVASASWSSTGKVILYSLSSNSFSTMDVVSSQTANAIQKDSVYGR